MSRLPRVLALAFCPLLVAGLWGCGGSSFDLDDEMEQEASWVPPPPTLTSTPPVTTSSALASFSFVTPNATSYVCSLDSAVFASCASPKAYSMLAEGQHTFAVKARSRNNKESAATSFTWRIDAQLPAAPTGLVRTAATTATLNLDWNDAPDTGSGVAGYNVYVNSTFFDASDTSDVVVTGLQCGTNYSIAVETFDQAANISARTTLATSTSSCADSQPPSVPTGQRFTSITSTSVTMAWNASTDNIAVTGYRAYLNNALVGTTQALLFTYTGLGCGTSYTVGLEAVDAAGNASNIAYAQGPVTTATCSAGDTQPPMTPGGLSVTGVGQTALTLNWNASTDNVGVTGYGVYRNSALLGTVPSLTYALTGLTCATSYVLAVDAVDAAGNRSAKASITGTTASCSSGGNVITFSGTVSASQFLSQISAAPAGGLTVQPASGQTSFTVIGDFRIARQNVTIQHAVLRDVTVGDSGSGFVIEDSNVHAFVIDGADNWTLRRCTVAFNGVSYNGNGGSVMFGARNWKILDSTFTGAYVTANPSQHTEAWYIGAGNDGGLIQGNLFDDNGTTGHVFFTWWGEGQSGSGAFDPKNICVRSNTFQRSKNPWFSIQIRGELPLSTNIRVDPNNISDRLLIGNEGGETRGFIQSCGG